MANLKSEFKTQFEWLERCSENGVSELQITFCVRDTC